MDDQHDRGVQICFGLFLWTLNKGLQVLVVASLSYYFCLMCHKTPIVVIGFKFVVDIHKDGGVQ
ncbi:hypothetical protein SAMN03159341_11465 [Paenibacillus sp. 1_12]|nr:hypothetical protein SAMN03159341_11465 [Paenibacillus sp. 1_12]